MRKLVAWLAMRTLYAVAFAAACGSASALPAFTWNPAGVGLAGTSFTADNIIVSSFSTVTFTSGTTFHEEGYLRVSSFQLAGNNIVAGGLNSTYSLYFHFTGDGIISDASYSSLNYQLFGTPSVPTFGPGGTISPVVTPIQLMSGSLISSDLTTVDGLPAIDATVTFNAATNPFFVSPASSTFYDEMTLSLRGGTITPTANGFMIDNSGGSANFGSPSTVPEPGTLALLGFGLLGVAVARRRRQ